MALKQHQNTNYRMSEDIEQINRESAILKQLDHPNIMKCYQQINFPDQILQVFEYIDGEPLSRFIQNQFPYEQNLEEFVNIKQLYKELEPQQEKPDFNFIYQSLVRKLLKPKLQQQNRLDDVMVGYQMRPIEKEQIDYEELQLEAPLEVSKTQMAQSALMVPQQPSLSAKPKYIQAVEHIFKQLVDTLIYLEDKETMHRDLKPDNIMVTKSLQLKIIDFGFVKKSNVTQTFVGSTGYMAPEIYISEQRGKGFNHKVDVWSAGVILYQMLYGYCPILVAKDFMFMGLQAQKGLYLPVDLFENSNEKMAKVIERTLIADPAQRPGARELLKLFNQHADTVVENKIAMKELTICCIGDYQVGKTTILNAMAKSQLKQQISQLQRQVVFNGEKLNLLFNDTLGTESRQGSLIPQIFRNTHICFFVFSRQSENSFKNLGFYHRIVDNQSPNCLRVTVAVNYGGEIKVTDKADYELDRQQIEVEDMLKESVRKCLKDENFDMKESVLQLGAEPPKNQKKKCC